MYKDFGAFLREHFPYKVQKISVNAGFTCPNRDGKFGTGGCTYCNNQTFNPEYCSHGDSVTTQLENGKRFFARKYPEMRYLAYFQAYTNTYGELQHLIELYEEALLVPDVVGLIIGTRPDCMPDELLTYLSELSKRTFVLVEYGAETTDDSTLKIINRGHTYACTCDAVERTHRAGVLCGLHMILGLPGESRELMIEHARRVSLLPIDTIKLHQLQIIRGTRMHRQWESGELQITIPTVDEYISLCVSFIKALRPTIAIERFVSQSPDSLLVAPRWGLKNYEFTARLLKKLKQEE